MEYIYDITNGNKYNIFSKEGKDLLKQYIKIYQSGGANSTNNKITLKLNKLCKMSKLKGESTRYESIVNDSGKTENIVVPNTCLNTQKFGEPIGEGAYKKVYMCSSDENKIKGFMRLFCKYFDNNYPNISPKEFCEKYIVFIINGTRRYINNEIIKDKIICDILEEPPTFLVSINHRDITECSRGFYRYNFNRNDSKFHMVLGINKGTSLNNIKVPISFETKVSILYSALEKLRKLHEADYIHRDIKLENIVTNGGNTTFIDFGSAIQCEESVCDVEKFQGTKNYTPFDHMVVNTQGNKYDLKVSKELDVFSFGRVIYEFLLDSKFKDKDRQHLSFYLEREPNNKIMKHFISRNPNLTTEFLEKHSPVEIEESIRQDEDLCDLLLKMMTQYREDRCSVEEALKHRFFKKYTNIKNQTSSKLSKPHLQSSPKLSEVNNLASKLPETQTENITK